MAKSKLEFHDAGFEALLKNVSLVADRAQAIAEACNAQSSWGGYGSSSSVGANRASARVWTYARQDGRGTTERAQRMIKNLDAGG